MEPKYAYTCAAVRHHNFWKLATLALPCVLLSGPAVWSELPPRPVVAPGGNNWKAPAGPVVCALGTQDLNAGLTPADLVTALLGPGVTVFNVTFTGANPAAGTFVGGTGIVGFESGIILSSGDIAFVPGPNTQDDVTADNLGNGDIDLDGLIPGYSTFDACVLEFDFECQSAQVIQFQYVFTSEEYNEWVNSPYNDVFGFFLNGVNIALVPGGGLAVSINNVNCGNPYNPPGGSFCNLHINNDCDDIPPGTFPCAGVRDTQMDGLTVVLTATGTLNPGLNHIKLAVADAGDHILDSNVFIQGQSFACGQPSGACCHTGTLTCQDYVLQANCQAPGDVWSVGLTCSQLNPPCAPPNQTEGVDCENPILITALPYLDVNTTCMKDNDYSDSCLGYYDNGDDILYVLPIAGSRCVNITVTGATATDNWIGVVVDNVCPPGAACIAQATTGGTVVTISNLLLTTGTYYLMIDRWPLAEDCINYTLSIVDCAAPTGACCDTNAGTCQDNVLEADCQGLYDVWNASLACIQLPPPCGPGGQPGGVDCEDPILIGALPFTDVNTTCAKDDNYADTCLGLYDDGQDIVYMLPISGSKCVNITVSGATANDNWVGLVVDSVCPPGATCLAQVTSTGTLVAISNLTLTTGLYYLMIDRWPGADVDCLNFTLTIEECPATTGACCFGTYQGACQTLTESDCTAQSGTFRGAGVACDPSGTSVCGCVGDCNCDGIVNFDDISAFVEALSLGISCNFYNADCDGSGFVDFDDINSFVALLSDPLHQCP
jgi:hypothetical protein